MGVLAGAAVFGGVFVAAMRAPLYRADEAWFLWVAVRANHGIPLYRDVYYVTTPLAMWLMQLGVAVFGIHVWVERLLVSLAVTASVLLVWAIGGELGASRKARLWVGAVVLMFGTPVSHFESLYSTLAVAFVLAATLVLLRTRRPGCSRRDERVGLMMCGGLVALAGATKPNIGATAGLIIVVILWRGRDDRPRRSALEFVGATLVTSLLLSVPLLLSGTFGAMVGDVFVGKGTAYLSVESHHVLADLEAAFSLVTRPDARLGSNVAALVEALPIVTVALLGCVVRAMWRTRRQPVLTVAALTLVGFVASAPDFARQHLTEAVPLLVGLTGMAFAATHTARTHPSTAWRRTVAVVAAAALAVGAVSVAVAARRPLVHGRDLLVAERAAPTAGIVTTHNMAVWSRADLQELRADTHGTVFLEVLSASYYYLTGHLRDPTPYDYPVRSDLGASGETGVIAALRRHRVAWACVARYRRPTPLQPLRLEHYLRRHYHFVEALHACDLYTSSRHPSRADQ